MTAIKKQGPFVDETFGVGTFYRLIGFPEGLIRSLHAVGDGTVAATITVQHCDLALNLDGSSLAPDGVVPSTKTPTPGWGLKGAATTVGVGDPRLWQPDTAIGTLTVAASATVTGGARATYGNLAARYSRVVIVVTVGGRLVIDGVGVA